MRFLFTMNMPSHKGNLVHQVIGDHEAQSIEELVSILSQSDFFVVDEVYKNDETHQFNSVGQTVLNPLFIGKVREFIRR